MSKAVALNIIGQLLADVGSYKRSPVGTEIARLIFMTRNWSVNSLRLQGATDEITRRNINVWLNEFEYMFASQMTNINTLAGYSGWGGARMSYNNIFNKKLTFSSDLFLENYKKTLQSLINKDLTKAHMLARSLQIRWQDNWREFYNTFDLFAKEGYSIGLTSKEIEEKFMREALFKNNVSLTDSLGRYWKPENYSAMYARTRSSEMEDDIMADEMQELGMDVVQISSHRTETPICKQYEGKFFSLTGETQGLPVLRVRPPFHPNCWHFVVPKRGDNMRKMVNVNRDRDNKIKKFNKGLSDTQKDTIVKQEKYITTERLGKKG